MIHLAKTACRSLYVFLLGYIFQNGFLKVQLWGSHRPWGYNGQNEKRAKHSPNHQGLGEPWEAFLLFVHR